MSLPKTVTFIYYLTEDVSPFRFYTFVTKLLLKRCYINEIADPVLVFSVHKNPKLAKNSQNLLKLIVVNFSWFKIRWRLSTAIFFMILSF